jgi:hypothetical protein
MGWITFKGNHVFINDDSKGADAHPKSGAKTPEEHAAKAITGSMKKAGVSGGSLDSGHGFGTSANPNRVADVMKASGWSAGKTRVGSFRDYRTQYTHPDHPQVSVVQNNQIEVTRKKD